MWTRLCFAVRTLSVSIFSFAAVVASPILILGACASHPAENERAPAAAGSDPALSAPMPAVSQTSWLYFWTNDEKAKSNARHYLSGELDRAEDCARKISDAAISNAAPVEGCEGDAKFAGAGLYTCDNPFTAHDTGRILVAVKTVANDKKISNVAVNSASNLSTGKAIERAKYAVTSVDGLLFDYRATDFGDLALSIRNKSLVDNAETFSLQVPDRKPKRFADHAAFKCSSKSTLREILDNWGDQIDFMTLTYESFRDNSGQSFQNAHRLNPRALAAAIAGDTVAQWPTAALLHEKMETLANRYPEFKEATGEEACAEADRNSPRSCFATELYSSIADDQGIEGHPTHAWTFPTTIKVLIDLKVLSTTEASALETQSQLMRYLASRSGKDKTRLERINEAFQCMLTIKKQTQSSGLATWLKTE